MAHMAMVYRRPTGVMRQSVKPQLASWDRAAHPSQVKLGRFLAHVDVIAGPVLATVSGRVAAELIVGFGDGASLIDGGHDLDNYLFPVAQRLGPERVAAIFGRKIHGPSSLAVGPAQPDTAETTPQFATRMTGSYVRRQWKQELHDRLAVQAAAIDPGPVELKIALTTGPGRNWASLWKPLIDAFGAVLGEDPSRPFHPHDDRIVSLGLHHTIDTGIAHDVIIGAWWNRLLLTPPPLATHAITGPVLPMTEYFCRHQSRRTFVAHSGHRRSQPESCSALAFRPPTTRRFQNA
jgi:hypothetical protein